MEQEITQRVNQAIQEKVFPGCVIGLVKKSGERLVLPFGHFTYDLDSPKVEQNTIYDVASVTKSVATVSMLLWLIDQKQIGLTDTVAHYIPEFGTDADKKRVTIRHLLTYTLDIDFPSTESLKGRTPDEFMERVMSSSLKNPPGTTFVYTNATAGFMGEVVERVAGESLDVLTSKYFFTPLGMTRTTFHPQNFSDSEVAPTEIVDWRGGLIHKVVHDDSTYMIREKHVGRAAGLFSTVPDLLIFLEMLLQSGMQNGVRYFSSEVVQQMHTNQIANMGESYGLGWELNESFMGVSASQQAFGKRGFTGCSIVCDPIKDIAFVFLSNHVYPKRSKDKSVINVIQQDIADIIFSSI